MANEKNLKKFDSNSGRVAGKKSSRKGVKNLSTLIKDIADNIDWENTTLGNKVELSEKYGKNGWAAIIYVAFTMAMTGNVKAMEWLAKRAYGDKLDLHMTNDPEKTREVIDEVKRFILKDTKK